MQLFASTFDHKVCSLMIGDGPITKWFKGYPDSLASVDPLLAKLDLPVQIFWGELDQFLFVENAHNLEKRLPRSRVKTFANAGHYVYQDKTTEFAEMVLDWVDSAHTEI